MHVYILTSSQRTSNPSCALVEPYAALLIGLGSAPINVFVSRALKQNVSRLKHDDPKDMSRTRTNTRACAYKSTRKRTCTCMSAHIRARMSSNNRVRTQGIDDVVDATPVHGACGLFGLLITSFFVTPRHYKQVCAHLFTDICLVNFK